MGGINRANSYTKLFNENRKASGIKCIFLSHQQNDKVLCRKIADYLLAADIDVYFDEDDNDLKIYRQTNNPNGVVDSIKKGINESSHMLVIVSPNTINSSWVPWEIGYGYDKTSLYVLTLKGIPDYNLPDYLKTTNIIRGTKTLNEFLANISNSSTLQLEGRNLIKSFNAFNNPLNDYLDGYK
jgi:hypothetical protein